MNETALAELRELVDDDLFFDASKIEPAPLRYVAWVDALGTRSAALVSHARSINFVMKIHAAVLASSSTSVTLFPMNDGVFIVSESWYDLRVVLGRTLRRLALAFTVESNPLHRLMIRGAVAFGPLTHGPPLAGNNKTLLNDMSYVSRIAMGMPLVQAFQAERNAPPFGIAVHESARAFAPQGDKPLHYPLWDWRPGWTKNEKPEAVLVDALPECISAHYQWVMKNPATCLYPLESARRHFALAREYFNIED